MWNKISEEMTALAEDRSEEDIREELMSWMDQVPTVLQDIIPKQPPSLSRDVHLKSEPGRTGSQMAESLSGEFDEKTILSETLKSQLNSMYTNLYSTIFNFQSPFQCSDDDQMLLHKPYPFTLLSLDKCRGITTNSTR